MFSFYLCCQLSSRCHCCVPFFDMETKKKVLTENIEKVVVRNIADEVREYILDSAQKCVNTHRINRICDIRRTLKARLPKDCEESLKKIVVWEDIRKFVLDSDFIERMKITIINFDFLEDIPKSDIENAIDKCIEKFCTRDCPTYVVPGSADVSCATTNIGGPDFVDIEDITKSIGIDTHRAKVEATFKENIEKFTGMQVAEEIKDTVPYAQCMEDNNNLIAKVAEDILENTVTEEDIGEAGSAAESSTTNIECNYIDKPDFSNIYEDIMKSIDMSALDMNVCSFLDNNNVTVNRIIGMESIIMKTINNTQCMINIKQFIAGAIEKSIMENVEEAVAMEDIEKEVMDYIRSKPYIGLIEITINELVEHYVEETVMEGFDELCEELINKCVKTELIKASRKAFMKRIKKFSENRKLNGWKCDD